MAQDPLEQFRKIQQQIEAIRRAQGSIPPNINISNPAMNVRYSFKTGGPSGPAPGVPDPLIEWLIADLPPRAFHDLSTETVARTKAKGFRPGHLPREEGLKLLKKRYDQDPGFRVRVGQEWLKGREKEDQAFRLLKVVDLRRNPWPVIEKFGFPLSIWLMLLSSGGQLRAVGLQALKEIVAKQGKLEEILAAAAKNAPPAKNLLDLPAVSHNEEVARIQREVEQILSERDEWRKTAELESAARARLEAELKQLREEAQGLIQARSTADHSRQKLEEKIRDLQSHLDAVKDAETAVKRLEKSLRDAGHQLSRVTKDKEELAHRHSELASGVEELKQRQKELETSLRCMAAFARPAGPSTTYRGEIILLVTTEETGAYFEEAKRLGITLLTHAGNGHDAQFDKFVGQAWRIVVLGEEEKFWKGLPAALRESGKIYVWLPAMAGPAFGTILSGNKNFFKS